MLELDIGLHDPAKQRFDELINALAGLTGKGRQPLLQCRVNSNSGLRHVPILPRSGNPRDCGWRKRSAPRIITIKIPVEKIRERIGSGGKTIRSIVERTGVKIDVEDDGRINIASSDDAAAQKAISIIQELTATPELDKVYMGSVQRITTATTAAVVIVTAARAATAVRAGKTHCPTLHNEAWRARRKHRK